MRLRVLIKCGEDYITRSVCSVLFVNIIQVIR
jgi:hypothetical protein